MKAKKDKQSEEAVKPDIVEEVDKASESDEGWDTAEQPLETEVVEDKEKTPEEQIKTLEDAVALAED